MPNKARPQILLRKRPAVPESPCGHFSIRKIEDRGRRAAKARNPANPLRIKIPLGPFPGAAKRADFRVNGDASRGRGPVHSGPFGSGPFGRRYEGDGLTDRLSADGRPRPFPPVVIASAVAGNALQPFGGGGMIGPLPGAL